MSRVIYPTPSFHVEFWDDTLEVYREWTPWDNQPWNYFRTIPTNVTQRYRQTDGRTDDLPRQYRAVRSIAR